MDQLTSKWSSRPKRDDAARVRENQRRHRDRVKCRISDLERQLAETRKALDEALRANALLISELEAVRSGSTVSSRSAPLEPAHSRNQGGSRSPESDQIAISPAQGGEEGEEALLESTNGASSDEEPAPLTPDQQAPPAGVSSRPSPSCSPSMCPIVRDLVRDSPLPTNADVSLALRHNCDNLQPAAPGESTMLCGDAYSIIAQQNVDDVDTASIGRMLAPGFRRGLRRNDGCRVETSRVYSAIDAITPM